MRRVRVMMAGALALAAGVAPAGAQVPGAAGRAVAFGPVFESWRFGDGLYQFDGSADSVRVDRATQWSLPWAVSVALGQRWTVDAGGAYVAGVVRTSGEGQGARPDLELRGMSDTRVRAVGRLVGDRVLLTLGAAVPSGRTRLEGEEFQAARVLAAPALGLASTPVGSGAGGLAGVVVTQQALGWSLGLGATYERRGSYAPVTASVLGGGAADYQPGAVVHVSLAADRLVGASALTLAVTSDFYGEDALTLRPVGDDPRDVAVRLGPVITGEARLRLASAVARDVTLYVVERYRAPFTRGGVEAAGSSGHQLSAGARGVLPAFDVVGVLLDIDAQYQTGLAVDNSVATVAAFSSGAMLGLQIGRGALAATPFVRARYGVFGSDDRVASGTFLGGGLSISARF
ncbi:MAG: hypothetical protein ACXW0Z_04330 [Gemmatirosa sp.]